MSVSEEDFNTTHRNCNNCSKSLAIGQYFKCSRCGVYVYCGRECQATHWKKGHRGACQQSKKPIGFDDIPMNIPRDGSDDADMDVKYKYIVVYPDGGKKHTREDLFALTKGFQTDPDFDVLFNYDESKSPSIANTARENIRKRFNFPTDIGSSVMPGFSLEYNGIILRAYHDDCFATELGASLAVNSIVGLCLVADPGTVRGIFIFVASYGETEEKTVLFTRRDIVSLAHYTQRCLALNTLPDRVRFENIRRAELTRVLGSRGFSESVSKA